MKICSKCKKEKDTLLFVKDCTTSDGFRSDCKDCHNKNYHSKKHLYKKQRKIFRQNNLEHCRKQALNWYYDNKDVNKNSRLKRMYGITLVQHNQMLKDQDYKCAICGTDKPDGKGNQFNVDHDHTTGKVRGLLCWSCNSLIGYSKENIQSLKTAVDYLIKHSS